MPAVTVTPADLAPFAEIGTEKAEAMIADALALAAQVAPCITENDFTGDAAAKAIIRGAILRWDDAGSGGTEQQTVGPFGQTITTPRRGMFWPSEIVDLQRLCRESDSGGAFAIDTVGCGSVHSEVCSLNFGANYCSCGADIAGWPLYEVGP